MNTKENTIKKKMVNCLLAGGFVAFAACLYMLMPYHYLGAAIFPVGIFLVMKYAPMLLTKGWPAFLARSSEYKTIDIIHMIVFNGIACIIIAGIFAIIIGPLTGYASVQDKIFSMVNTKLSHTILNDLILAIACGATVAATGIPGKFTKNKLICNFATWGLIFLFVYFKFEHSVADMYYFSLYSFLYGFQVEFVTKIAIFIIGNLIGGGLVGYGILRNIKRN